MKHRVAVIGAGITGAFSAYFLTRLGAVVTVVERDEPAAAASGRNAGGLNPLHGPGIPGPMMELALASLRLHLEHWDELRTASSSDFRGSFVPRLQLALDELEAQSLAEREDLYNSIDGLSARLIARDELRRIEPRVSRDALVGLWTEGNARVDPEPYTQAVLAAAAARGAHVVRAEACELRHRDGTVTGVILDSGSLDCDGVVLATGPWCEGPSRWLGVNLPVEPLKGELLLVRSPARPVEVEITWGLFGIHRAAGETLLLGGTEEQVGFDSAPTESGRARILEGVKSLVPGLGELELERHVAALRPVTPDGFPILGIPSGWENVCVAVGSGRKGLLLGAGLGLASAELLTRGSTGLAVSQCAPERWELVR